MIRDALIAKAQKFKAQNIPLPIDLYIALCDQGVDARTLDTDELALSCRAVAVCPTECLHGGCIAACLHNR